MSGFIQGLTTNDGRTEFGTSPMTSNSGFFPLLGLPISVSMFLPFIPLCPRGRVHFWNLLMLVKLLQNSPGH